MKKNHLILALALFAFVFVGVTQAFAVTAYNVKGKWIDWNSPITARLQCGTDDGGGLIMQPSAANEQTDFFFFFHHPDVKLVFWPAEDSRSCKLTKGFVKLDVFSLLMQLIDEDTDYSTTVAATDEIGLTAGFEDLFGYYIPVVGYVDNYGKLHIRGGQGTDLDFAGVNLQVQLEGDFQYYWFKLIGDLEGSVNVFLGGAYTPFALHFMIDVNAQKNNWGW